MTEFDSREFDHVDFNAVRCQVVEQGAQKVVGRMVQHAGSKHQDHAHHTQRFLLKSICLIEHANVDDDLAAFVAWMGWEFNAQPAVAFVGAMKVSRGDGIGKGKEGGRVPAVFPCPRGLPLNA
jgi:hypothetical protein